MKETLTIVRLLGKLLMQLPGKMIKKVRTSARKPKGVADDGAKYANLYISDDGSWAFGSLYPYNSLSEALWWHIPELKKGKVYRYRATVKISFS